MKYLTHFLLLFLLSNPVISNAQQAFTRIDSLSGSITPERSWWDLTYYHLDVEVLPDQKFISGSVTIQYIVLTEGDLMQIDLQEPLSISKVVQKGKELSYSRFGPIYTIQLQKKQKVGRVEELIIYYSGYPQEARRAPWDGGFSWTKDVNGNDFIATSCQGVGASIWWPCKEHLYDEVDSMLISVTIPDHLTDVSNGRLRGIDINEEKKTKTFHWFVNNPINNYGVNINIGDYIHWNEVFEGENGPLDCDYWVLSYNEEIAKEHFKQGRKTLEAFEYWFGPYPFYEDGYKLVEVPYLGMEHQSSVTYGNGFKNGYKGTDVSKTGWGLEFDYIIIHESGHEWFANNITYKDPADMWLHESFACYSESLYLDYWFGKEAGEEYNKGLRKDVKNKETMIGPYDVRQRGADLYDKGAQLLEMIRQIINDDEKWRQILRGLNKTFYHQTVETAQIEEYISQNAQIDLSFVFDQYLRTIQIPTFEYYFLNGYLTYRWQNVIPGFNMPIDVYLGEDIQRLTPKVEWQKIKTEQVSLEILSSYYVASLKD
jgi:aminopeptidase N